MRRPSVVRRSFLVAVLVTTLLLTVGTSGAGLHAAAAPAGWRALFPPALAYPQGTHLLPVQTATRAGTLLAPAAAAQVTRAGFVTGGAQYATLPAGAVASVTVLVFHTAHGAAAFLLHYHPAELADSSAPGVTVPGLADGGRYVAGACATCGPSAAPVGVLLVRRGEAVVQILTQPTNRSLAMRLGHAALRQ